MIVWSKRKELIKRKGVNEYDSDSCNIGCDFTGGSVSCTGRRVYDMTGKIRS